MLYLVDTNILLRLVKRDHLEYPVVRQAVDALHGAGAELGYTLQNLTEFWNASTRSKERNGFGLSIAETEENARDIEDGFVLLSDTEAVRREWRRIVFQYRVSGIQVYDARLAAAMYAHGISRILTFNTSDFQRFAGIEAVHPREFGQSEN